MAIVHLTGFMSDRIFEKTTRVDLSPATDQTVGWLDSNLIDYFTTIGRISDMDQTRLSILGNIAVGQRTILFDTLQIEDSTVWDKLTPEQFSSLFAISELAYLSQNQTTEAIEYLITSDPTLSLWYVTGSLVISPVTVSAIVYSPTTSPVTIPNWIEFQIYLNTEHTDFFKIKLWLNKDDFKVGYPYTYITRVVAPRDPSILLAPAVNMSSIESLISDGQYTFGQINEDLYVNDQTGLYIFTTKYVLDANTSYRIPFGLLYRGANPPTTMACRSAIKAYLLATGLTNEDDLKTYFPELFVDLHYFIVPMWDYFTQQADKNIYPVISPTYDYINERLTKLYPTLPEDYATSRIISLLGAYSDIWLAVVPDPLNGDTTSLLDLYPTYNNHSSSQVEFAYMDADAKAFSTALSRAMAVLNQALATNEFNTIIQDSKQYICFTIGRAEYWIMDKTSYTTAIAS